MKLTILQSSQFYKGGSGDCVIFHESEVNIFGFVSMT